MASFSVLVCDQLDLGDLNLGASFRVDYRPAITHEELLKAVPIYDVIIVRSRTKVGRDVIEKGRRLKVIARSGTGLDNIDLAAAASRGVRVVSTPESLVEAVAEHTTLLLLALSRKLTFADSSVKRGNWSKENLLGVELNGRALGVVGLGRVGRRVGEIARVIGMSIIAYDVVPIPPETVEKMSAKLVDLDTLFSSSDFVTLHVPLTEETRHMVDARRLGLMRTGSFLVNTSRGGVVDERALAAALREGRLGGAALDVFEQEPPTGAILTAPNIILTPHIGGQTAEAQRGAITSISHKIVEALSSE